MKNLLLLLLVTFVFSTISQAQKAIFRGGIFNEKGKDPIVGASVRFLASNAAGISNENGKIELKTNPGIYNIEVSPWVTLLK